MFNESDPLVPFKLDILRRGLPAQDAIVFGDIYGVDGAYTAKCIEYGCSRALLIDSHETAAWLRLRLEQPAIDFYKGDFADPFFMASVRETYEIGVAFDVLLHQASLLQAIHLMLEKVCDRSSSSSRCSRRSRCRTRSSTSPGTRIPTSIRSPIVQRSTGYSTSTRSTSRTGSEG